MARDERRSARRPMFKRAQIQFSGESLNCIMLDLSAAGARICSFTQVEMPEIVTILLPNGATRLAHRRWQRGTDIGFEFVHLH